MHTKMTRSPKKPNIPKPGTCYACMHMIIHAIYRAQVAPSGEIEAREDTAAPVPEGSAAPEDQQDDEAEDPEIAPKPGKRRRMKTRRVSRLPQLIG